MLVASHLVDEVNKAVVGEQLLGVIAKGVLSPDVLNGGEQAVGEAIERLATKGHAIGGIVAGGAIVVGEE